MSASGPVAGTPQRYAWRRRSFPQTLVRFAVQLGLVAVLVWALRDLDIFWPWVLDAPEQMADLFGRMVPPNWTAGDLVLAAMVQTVHIATLATLLAVVLALPVTYLAAQNTSPNAVTLAIGRFIVVATRSVNTIIWALLFVAIFGPGALAGILAVAFRSIGFLGKLVGESIEECDRRPVEAMTATGASKAKVILYGIVPQVLPTFFAVTILRWDVNIRESTVLGLVGAGGIGLLLQGAIDTFRWQEVSAILLAILAVVVLGEVVSGWLRRKVM
ncbi:MAG: phosphonate ABC transporter, permease protein PhnE [Trueperaceae bacterium]